MLICSLKSVCCFSVIVGFDSCKASWLYLLINDIFCTFRITWIYEEIQCQLPGCRWVSLFGSLYDYAQLKPLSAYAIYNPQNQGLHPIDHWIKILQLRLYDGFNELDACNYVVLLTDLVLLKVRLNKTISNTAYIWKLLQTKMLWQMFPLSVKTQVVYLAQDYTYMIMKIKEPVF